MKFIVDEMLGRLAKWLRLLGYDTVYLTPTTDSAIIRQALKEQRIVLTRDRRMVERKHMPRYLLIDSDRYPEQLKQVIQEFVLVPKKDNFFCRCLLCNTLIQTISKAEIFPRVPAYTFKTQAEFFNCPHCNKIYWTGTHIAMIQQKLKEWGILL